MQRQVEYNMSMWQGLKGKYVVFDGVDGSGKTTLMQRVTADINGAGGTVMDVREPGGTTIGEAIRSVLLDKHLRNMHVRTEVLLFMASRAQLIQERVIPHLRDGYTVVADRGLSSTLAYQGTGGGIRFQDIVAVADAVLDRVWPDLTIICDVGYEVAKGRMHARRRPADRIEDNAEDYHKRVRMGFLRVAKEYPDRCVVIDGNASAQEMFEQAVFAIAKHFAGVCVERVTVCDTAVWLHEDLTGRDAGWCAWCPVHNLLAWGHGTRSVAISEITQRIKVAQEAEL